MRTGHALIRIEATGQVCIYTEVSPHGQGTETTFAQIAADALGVRPADVQVLHGDTAMLPAGQGTFASRGLAVGGSAMYAGLQQARQKLVHLAAHLLDCWPEDVVFQESKVFSTQNPERIMTFAKVAAAAQQRELLPHGTEIGLEFPVHFALRDNPFGFGAHVAIVEVDRDTGILRVLRYVAVHDCGQVINPKLLEGQVYGAIAQGLGQALGEGMLYSPEGQPLTGSLLDYPLPRAKDMMELRMAIFETLSPTNPLGLKGIGELPTVACPVALVNAVVDALSGTTEQLNAPLTPEKIWRALQEK
jgi:carbon-monoxide dehydrogenase large subunit